MQKTIPYILVENSREALAKLWSNFYKNPSKNMKIIAITGTNGKTSTSYFLYNILKADKKSVGLISTIEILVNNKPIKTSGGSDVIDKYSAMTTPDPEILYYLLYIMKKNGVEYVVMEASSHALAQCKLEGLDVEIGVFTNLSKEHLDYHKTMEKYFLAKEELFKKSRLCVINIDDEFGIMMLNRHKGRSFSVSTSKESDFTIKNIKSNALGVSYTLVSEDESMNISTKVGGSFNAYNSALASICALMLGIEQKSIKQGVFSVTSISGRLERYKNKNIYIDYAHTPFAVEKVINAVKGFGEKHKIIVLIGCGGNRDKTKRAEIGKICTSRADLTIITSDNPRDEEPVDIIKDIFAGVVNDKCLVIPNRREAIRYATGIMKKTDILLLLGKGHERYEIDKTGKHDFDERVILEEVFSVDKN